MDATAKELVVFWRKLGRLLESGVPILHAMDVIRQETANSELQRAIDGIHASIKEGGSFHEGLSKTPNLFPLSVRTIIKAADAAGRMDKAIFEIAEGIEEGSLLPEGAEPLLVANAVAPKTEEADAAGGGATTGGDDSEIPVIKLASSILHDAWKARASDIHLESSNGDLRVRVRIDGVLRDMPVVEGRLAGAVISRLKIMANMKVAEQGLPQDGRIQLNIQGQSVDLRVCVIPCMDGENMVLRILPAPAQLPKLEAHGFTAPKLALLRSWLAKSYGLILVVGPTGCGKTTTLYSMVEELNRPEVKILTAEDPVGYHIQGVSQMQIRPSLGLTCAAALRAILRQDPDVIMATEIRDLDSANILIHAVLTGHLVMSTLHTPDTSEALQRLTDIGVEPFLIDSTLIGIISQRLVRMVCPKCKEEYQPESRVCGSIKLPPGARFFRGKGCEHCSQTGYRGRTVIHELLEMDDSLRKAVKEEAGPARFRELACRAGMVSLRDDGIAKAREGITTLEEVLRTC